MDSFVELAEGTVVVSDWAPVWLSFDLLGLVRVAALFPSTVLPGDAGVVEFGFLLPLPAAILRRLLGGRKHFSAKVQPQDN
jgi:hypothetical protein